MHGAASPLPAQVPSSPRPGAIGRSRSLGARVSGSLSAAIGAVSGLAPHVLHHIAPIAGAAVLTGAAGSVLFGALGLALMVPMLLRLRRRFNSWLAPGIALALFAAMFTVSTLWIGPAIRGDDGGNGASPKDEHDHSAISRTYRIDV